MPQVFEPPVCSVSWTPVPVYVSVLWLWRDTRVMTPLMKKKHFIEAFLQFRALVQYHHCGKHDGMHADLVIEKRLSILHPDLPAAERGRNWPWLELLKPQSDILPPVLALLQVSQPAEKPWKGKNKTRLCHSVWNKTSRVLIPWFDSLPHLDTVKLWG